MRQNGCMKQNINLKKKINKAITNKNDMKIYKEIKKRIDNKGEKFISMLSEFSLRYLYLKLYNKEPERLKKISKSIYEKYNNKFDYHLRVFILWGKLSRKSPQNRSYGR